jgi:hypothetical protein
MKLLPVLVCLVLWFPLPGSGQGIRMSADFLPLEVGNRWVYDVTNEAGAKDGQIEFAVEDYTIVSGVSFYVLTGFPFTSESTGRIRLVRYDRQERQFMRVIGDDHGPLFLTEAGTTEVLQTDPAGTPQKFLLKTDSMVLTFERGIGIVEARLETPGGPRIAKIVSTQGKSFAGARGASSAAVAGSTASTPSFPVIPLPPPVRTVETVTPVTDTNPQLSVYSMESAEGLKLVFVVENTSDKLLPFKFSSGQSYDFVITNAVTGSEVWRWSRGQFFTQVIRSEAIRGKARWTFEAVWKFRDAEGNPIPPGQYHLIGILTAQPPLQSHAAVLTVR